MGGKSEQGIIGFKYRLGVHSVLSYPVDEIQVFQFAKRTCWTGSATGGPITINKPNLFGGEDAEGGVGGTVNVLMGNPDQQKSSYLMAILGSVIPAFRGVCSVLHEGFYFGNNRYMKRPGYKLKRTDIHTDCTPIWYLAKSNINNGDINPAHILYECITNKQWGMGKPTSLIDDTNWRAAADQFYAEGLGLSLRWNGGDIDSFIKTIEDHAECKVDLDMTTGLFTLQLIRGGYDPDTLPLFDESNSELVEFERGGWGNTVNKTIVIYHDRETNKDVPVSHHDIGNIQIQGEIIPETKSYPGISNGALAALIAKRDSRVRSAALAPLRIIVDRGGYGLRRGDVFRYSNAKLGLSEVVFRAGDIDRGTLTDGRITVDAIEDVFGMESSSYIDPQSSSWTSPNTDPAPPLYQQLVEATYWDIIMGISPADREQLLPDYGFVLAHAVRASGDTYNYQIHTKVGTAEYARTGTGYPCPTAELDGALAVDGAALTDRVVNIKNGLELSRVVVDKFAYIGNECVAIRAIDEVAGTVTIDHGVLDTVPVDHADGERIWFVDGWQGKDRSERVDGEVVDVKLLPVTTYGALDIDDATAMQITLDNRPSRPYAPGNVQLNGSRYPASTDGDIAFTLSHRDRTQQTAYLVDQTEGNIGPEPGTTYTYRIYDAGSTLLKHTQSGETGGWTYTQTDRQADFGGVGPHSVRVEIVAVRDGHESYQPQAMEFTANDI